MVHPLLNAWSQDRFGSKKTGLNRVLTISERKFPGVSEPGVNQTCFIKVLEICRFTHFVLYSDVCVNRVDRGFRLEFKGKKYF